MIRFTPEATTTLYLVLFAGLSTRFGNSSQCPASSGDQWWWNGEKCLKCKPCPPGQGVKTKCTATQDTVCYDCISGHEYSDISSATDPCTSCFPDDPDSLCGYGNVHVARECTPTTKPICNKCKVGHYFYKMGSSCLPCSPPCKPGQHEEKSCVTEHDRICKPGTPYFVLTNTAPVPETTYPQPTNTTKSMTTPVGISSNKGGLLSFLPSPWNWVLVCFCLIVGLVVILYTLWRCYKYRQDVLIKREDLNRDVEEVVPLQGIPAPPAGEVPCNPDRPLTTAPSVSSAPPACTCNASIPSVSLDSRFLCLPVAWRRDMAFKLHSKDEYAPWKLIAEELGVDKSRIEFWDSRLQNPAEQLFKYYEQMEGSTIRHFIGLLRKQEGSSLLANEIERGISQGLSSPSELYPGQLNSHLDPNGEQTGEMNSMAPSEVQETEV